MKRIVVLIFVMLSFSVSRAQTWDELFNQNRTQIKYLLQQISASKVYIGYVKKGYSIARSGLQTIGELKDDHFQLDETFFKSLRTINPNIQYGPKVAEIVAINIKTIKLSRKNIELARKSNFFDKDEYRLLDGVFNKLIETSSILAEELSILISSGKLELSDDARISRINFIYKKTLNNYLLAYSQMRDLNIMLVQRARELRDAGVLRGFYK